MLVKCPECQLQVSDKASFCPHCGYPMSTKISYRPKTTRRLPNGFGQITKIKSKNLRNPYRAMVTVGKTPEGKPICKLLKPEAYFKTYNDAYAALVAFNKNPFDLSENISCNELFERWIKQHDVHKDRITSLKSAWKYCHELYNTPIREIRVRHIKYVIENGTITKKDVLKHPTVNTQNLIKEIFNSMFDYAVEYELVDKNYARDLSVSRIKETDEEARKYVHKAFTKEEFEQIEKSDEYIARVIYFQCYTGFRPTELLEISLDNVHLDEGYIVEGMKTKNGKDRIVPIHDAIKAEVKNFYDMSKLRGEKYLFSDLKNYDAYRNALHKLFPNHSPHDGRKHFITMAKKYKVDEYAIKRIVGHSIADLTESTYTERDLEWLKEEISKIV